jgi:hypothetical protein
VQRFAGFVYQEVRMHCRQGQVQSIEVTLEPHGGIRGRCSRCRRPAAGYDRLPKRRWLFVPLWGIPTWFCYAPRRVECAEHGVVVEHIPWSDGKRPVTCAMMGFLARWARRLSWREEPPGFGGVGGTFPAPACPPEGETGKGDFKFLAAAGCLPVRHELICYPRDSPQLLTATRKPEFPEF